MVGYKRVLVGKIFLRLFTITPGGEENKVELGTHMLWQRDNIYQRKGSVGEGRC